MAVVRVKTIEYRCPHCSKKLKSTPYNEYCNLGGKTYGDPIDTCPKCKQPYRNSFTIEPAEELTLSQQVPFFLTSVKTLVAEAVIAVMLVVLAFAGAPVVLWGLIPLAVFHVGLSAFTRSYRQKHKDKLLVESRERLKNPERFLKAVLPYVGENLKQQLTTSNLMLMHIKALANMEADKPVDMQGIICETFGLPKPPQEPEYQKKMRKLTGIIQIPGAIMTFVGLMWLLSGMYGMREMDGIESLQAWVLTGVGMVLLLATPKVTEYFANKEAR